MFNQERINKLQEYLTEVRIVDLLDKWGAEGKGNKYSCIFHEDQYPSMFVDDYRNVFYCHSCQRGGGSAKMLHYHYQQRYDTKNYFQSLEKYLDFNPKARKELGFSSIREENMKVSALDLEGICGKMDELELNRVTHEVRRNKYKPKRHSKDYGAIVEYCKRKQNKY